ncbi:MAG: type IX secretion system outer membrane channel protein PorV [Prevotella sp.]|uniref:type IX secretion system outer membrane channel protein PorV n=1 Tax=Prevotella sp. Rep29 TaxID=2691580 RepID=UPI001C6E09AA|nr:type IX secretion system outer membrane channel protein PorV [Prevotella sp. Rep29]MBQ3624684.1 type IX secretion system outer membrane channel protein PorV [Prevotella sp.]MBR2265151.1 type IX secretion system outer membrane channel protein PorV [Paludibacteraceae bacterium]MBR1654793.1 type IX secretion system outer membrane channel protein PorV [Prevotella sp.]MBR3389227.1 type IX secretion system outer membrane channel protein PorV [Prevotella sp.]MBR3444985.1 type IX secretion system o
MIKTIRISAIACLLLIAATTQAQNEKRDMFNPVNTSVTSQSIAPDARAAGMGDVGAATDPDVVSQYWNPAKYPFCISRAGVALNYTPWLRQLVNDMYLAYLSGYYRIGEYSAVSASLRYFSLGEVYTNAGQTDDNSMTINPYEMSLDVAYSLMLSEKFSIGAAVRWIHSDLTYDYTDDTSPGSAFAADIACYYQNYLNLGSRECQLGLGLNISNIGSKITFGGDNRSEFIPTNLRLGASLMVPIDEYNRITIAADANKLLVPTYPKQEEGETTEDYQERVQRDYYDVSSISGIFKSFGDAPNGFKEELEEIQWSVGAEYTYHDQFSIRAGYHHESENKGNRKYFTVGAGFRMSVFSLDAGYVIATAKSNPLDQTLRFTLSFDMDGIKDLFRRR